MRVHDVVERARGFQEWRYGAKLCLEGRSDESAR